MIVQIYVPYGVDENSGEILMAKNTHNDPNKAADFLNSLGVEYDYRNFTRNDKVYHIFTLCNEYYQV